MSFSPEINDLTTLLEEKAKKYRDINNSISNNNRVLIYSEIIEEYKLFNNKIQMPESLKNNLSLFLPSLLDFILALYDEFEIKTKKIESN